MKTHHSRSKQLWPVLPHFRWVDAEGPVVKRHDGRWRRPRRHLVGPVDARVRAYYLPDPPLRFNARRAP